MPLLSVKSHYQKVKAFYQRYERFFMPALIIWGFIYHYITFKIIPIDEVLYLVFGYLVLATLTILFTHLYDAGKITQKLRYVRLFIPLLLQFTLGSIIGGVFIFYWFSGSIFVSWPFIVILIALIIGIEAFKHHLENPVVQFSLYNFASILLFAVALPYFFNSLSAALFLAAGVISLLLVFILVRLLGRFSAELKKRQAHILISSCLVFVAMALLYFNNFIPPVPLSIRSAGVYHNVTRSGSDYELQAEPQSFLQKLDLTPTIHMGPGERAFVYTSIYTPTDLNTEIVHDWQFYNETKKEWISVSKLSFTIVGGRQDGYRGYTVKNNLTAGKWRVYVETPRGQVLGRFRFNVQKVAEKPDLMLYLGR
jgi:hypothetical protein